jgi:hypothetical protein
MSDLSDKPKGPLWKFVKHVQHAPMIRPPAAAASDAPEERLMRDLTEEDLLPLRIDGEWPPAVILKRFGSIKAEKEHLPRLLIACAIVQGPRRVRDMTERLLNMIAVATPRILRMIDDKSLERRHDVLKRLMTRLQIAKEDLIATKSRAHNDSLGSVDGMRGIDLEMLVATMLDVIMGSELASKRNLTGIDYALYLTSTQPDQPFVQAWIERAFGVQRLPGIIPFTPPDYGRTLIVYDDGRLAYDPAAPTEDPSEEAEE